ncbi:MAG: GntP family permease [Lentisphaeria bacterium]|nr:GntP family permease [Lentisphaeria bacterium]
MSIILLIAVIVAIIFITAVWKIHPLPILLCGAFVFGVGNNNGVAETLNMIASGFGNTMKSIGIVIILGTIIGVFMEQRGALKVIAEKIIGLIGQKNTPAAMALIGYVVSICIFCDSAFIILIGLWKKIGTLAKIPLAIGATALSMGLFASHCFIPPTPGPLAAMSILEAEFGLVLFFGMIAAIGATCAGYFFACVAGRNEKLDDTEISGNDTQNEQFFNRHWSIAFLPIIIPLFLIGANSIVSFGKDKLPAELVKSSSIFGTPIIALAIGAVLAIFVIGKSNHRELTVDGLMGKSVVEAANILVITASGGAFGEVLKNVDFTTFLPHKIGNLGVFALLIPLIIAAVLKIAQGSSTLAILTAASISLPLLDSLHLSSAVMRSLTCCAVCCGGMIFSHTNDSYFWVVTKFSGMSVRQGLKLQSLGTLISGSAAALIILLLGLFFG